MTKAASQASWQAVCMGGAHSELWAWRHERGSCEIHCAWASQLVEAPVICPEWHLLSLALPAQVPEHWKLNRHHQAASPWQRFGAAEGEEHLDAGRQLDCC